MNALISALTALFVGAVAIGTYIGLALLLGKIGERWMAEEDDK